MRLSSFNCIGCLYFTSQHEALQWRFMVIFIIFWRPQLCIPGSIHHSRGGSPGLCSLTRDHWSFPSRRQYLCQSHTPWTRSRPVSWGCVYWTFNDCFTQRAYFVYAHFLLVFQQFSPCLLTKMWCCSTEHEFGFHNLWLAYLCCEHVQRDIS